MAEKLKIKIGKSDRCGLIHDSRQDIRTLSKVCNELIEKVNELVDEINELRRKEVSHA